MLNLSYREMIKKLERKALRYTCPVCGAKRGEICEPRVKGDVPHLLRMAKAAHIPIDDVKVFPIKRKKG